MHVAPHEYVHYLLHVLRAGKALQDFETAMRARGYPLLRLVYEDNLERDSQWNSTVRCLLEYLGESRDSARNANVRVASSWPRKNTDTSLSADVRNYQELQTLTTQLSDIVDFGAKFAWDFERRR